MLSIKQMTPAKRAERINEIPHEKAKLQERLKVALRFNYIGEAASLRKKIKDLELEFSELYNSFGE